MSLTASLTVRIAKARPSILALALALILGAAAQDAASSKTAPAPAAPENGVLKNLTFSGDIQIQDDSISGGPANGSLDRNRLRYRVRLNLTTQLDHDFSGGVSVASGDVNDPTSTNQTATGFYTRKPLELNKAYLQFQPHAFPALTVTGGKFAYPWHSTQLVWDSDLNPEGLAETLAFPLREVGPLKQLAVVGFELPFAEVAGVALEDKSIAQSAVYGGQTQTAWQLARRLSLQADTGFYNYHNADPIALALAKASVKNPQTPGVGTLPLASGSASENSIVTTTAANQVTIGGAAYPTGVTTVTSAQFASKFGLFDTLARLDVNTGSPKWPLALIGDFVQNTEACANAGAIARAPANTAAVHYSQTTNLPCDPRQRRGTWFEARVGRGQQAGDWEFRYVHTIIEHEAVLSNFDYNNLRQGADVIEHIATAAYQWHRNVQLSFTGLIGRPLDPAPNETWLRRFDTAVTYSF
ncbi:MAG TPA: putative porin [Terriglobales bacterium]|jgi:hypothetical protein